MSRVMHASAQTFIAAGTGVDVLTCGTGKKLELVAGFWGSDGVAGHGAYLLHTNAGAGTSWIYSRGNTPAEYAFDFQWNGFVLVPTEKLTAFALGAGYAGLTLVLTYIEVIA